VRPPSDSGGKWDFSQEIVVRSYKNFTISVELNGWAEEKERNLHPHWQEEPKQ
jgi:hypothetical protein